MAVTEVATMTALSITNRVDYPVLFRDHIERSLRHVLAQAQATTILPDEVCEQALHTLSFALRLDSVWPLVRDLLLTLAPKLEQAGARMEWLPYLEQGLAQSQRVDDAVTSAELQLECGFLLQLQGNLEAARAHYLASVAGFARAGNLFKQAKTLNRLAFTTWLQRRYVEIPPLIEQVRDLLADDDPECANTELVLGWVAFDRRDWPTSVIHFTNALHLVQKQGSKRQIARRLRDLAAALQMQQCDAEAIHSYERAIALFTELQDPFEQAVASMNLGVVYLSRQQMSQALALFGAAEPTFRRVQSRLDLVRLYNNQAIAFRHLGEWAQAEQALQAALDCWQPADPLDILVNLLDELGVIYLEQGQYQSASDIFQTSLRHLAKMQDDPSYRYYNETVTSHWAEATKHLQ